MAQEPAPISESKDSVSQFKVAELNEKEAVTFAEKFVSQNGYTDLEPEKEALTRESIERESDVDQLLKMRRNTLERKAYGILRGRIGSPGWTVVFKYKGGSERQNERNGRAVTMGLDGSDARVEHKDFILAKTEKKL